MKMHCGVIGSSGGSALIAATSCLAAAGHELAPVIVSDRECGMTAWAAAADLPVIQLPYESAENFSTAALATFQEHGCADVLLYYTRRVAPPLIDIINVWNIHPALLPAFAGLHAVRQALAAQVGLFGATLHRVDAGLDTGPIIAQVAAPLPVGISEQRAQRLSYIQKVWLTLLWFERISGAKQAPAAVQAIGPGVALSSCGLADGRIRQAFVDWFRVLEPDDGRERP